MVIELVIEVQGDDGAQDGTESGLSNEFMDRLAEAVSSFGEVQWIQRVG